MSAYICLHKIRCHTRNPVLQLGRWMLLVLGILIVLPFVVLDVFIFGNQTAESHVTPVFYMGVPFGSQYVFHDTVENCFFIFFFFNFICLDVWGLSSFIAVCELSILGTRASVVAACGA